MNNSFKEKLGKMQSLMERMDKHQFYDRAMINEKRIISEISTPGIVTTDANEFFEKLNGGAGTKNVVFGYITVASVPNMPKFKQGRRNYQDWAAAGNELGASRGIDGIIKLTMTGINWKNAEEFGKAKKDFDFNRAEIRSRYGIEYNNGTEKDNVRYGREISDAAPGAVQYAGDNEALKGNTYAMQNGASTMWSKSVYYMVDAEGHIVDNPLDSSAIASYFKPYSPQAVDGVGALKKLGADDATIEAYSNEIKALKFTPRQFIHSQILFACGNFGQGRELIINPNISEELARGKNVNSLNAAGEENPNIRINRNDLFKIAEERYQVDCEAALNDIENHNIDGNSMV